MIGLWTSCSQVANITPENPLGLGRGLLVAGPNKVADEEWIPNLIRAGAVLGYRPWFMTWMDKGQVLQTSRTYVAKPAKEGDPVPSPPKIMCVDSYTSLIKSGTGRPWEYATAYRKVKPYCERLIVYHGAPDYRDSDGYGWMAPIWESEAEPCFDATGDCTTEEMVELANECEKRGKRYYVEPFVAQQTLWFTRKIPCFVLLQTVRDTIRKNWSPASGAAKDYPFVNVLVGNHNEIEAKETRGYLDRGWNVFYPLDTPLEKLAQFRKEINV